MKITAVKYSLLFIITTFSFLAVHARQQAMIDSLERILPTLTKDSAIARAYHNLSVYYAEINPDEAVRYARLGVAYCEKMGWKKGVGACYAEWATALSNKGDYTSAIDLFNKAYALHQEIGNEKGMAMVLCNIGTAHLRRGNDTAALHNYLQALRIVEVLKDTKEMALYNFNISGVFMDQSNFNKAIEYNNRAQDLYEEINDDAGLALTYEGKATIYNMQKKYPESESWYLKALKIYEERQETLRIAIVYSQLGIINPSDYRKGLDYKLKAQAIWDSLAPGHPNAIMNTGNLGVAYLDLVRYDTLHTVKPGGPVPAGRSALLQRSEIYLRKALVLSKEADDVDNLAHFTGVLSELQDQQGKHKEAYENFRIYYDLHDSLYSQETKNRLAAIEGEREIALRDKEIEINKLALASQKKQRFFLITGICLLAVIGGLLYRQALIRRKTNTTLLTLNNELDEANKVKTRFFSILSHDLRGPVANLINFLHLQQEAPDLMDKQSSEGYTKRITHSAEHLLETMEELLLWSKGQMEHFKPHISEVEVTSLFEDIRRQFAAAGPVTMNFEYPPSMTINTDEHYLRTIMRNLTGNALKALKHVAYPVITWKAWEEDGHTFLSITDNGPGITDQQLKALYDDTFAVGTKKGLGLHLVRDMAKAIDCNISVHSLPGQGTSFRLAV